jgi:trehalose/maltose hydrolase-like predicted phosphorylase
MNTFWLKIAVLAVAVLVAIILVSNFFSSEIDKATDLKAAAERHEAAEAKLQAQLQEAQTQVEQKNEQKDTTITPAETSPVPTKPAQTVADDDDIIANVEAERLYNMALTQYKIGRKIMTFKKMVDYCRELFDRFPDSPEAAKAKVLMRNMPERYRELYNVTEEELGFEK